MSQNVTKSHKSSTEETITPCCGNCKQFITSLLFTQSDDPTGLCGEHYAMRALVDLPVQRARDWCNKFEAGDSLYSKSVIDGLIARHRGTLDLLEKPADDEIREPFAQLMVPADGDPEKVNKIRTREILKEAPSCSKYTTYTWPKSAGDRIPAEILAELAEAIDDPLNDIEESLAAGPFCGAICSIDPRHILVKISRCRSEGGPTPEEMNRKAAETRKDLIRKGLIPKPAKASPGKGITSDVALDKVRTFAALLELRATWTCSVPLSRIIQQVRDGDLDLKQQEPAPCSTTTISNGPPASGQVSYTSDQTGGKAASEPAPTKPALDKDDLLKTLKVWAEDEEGASSPNEKKGYRFVIGLIERGTYDLPAASKPRDGKREHTCRCSTANLVELLRPRARTDPWIDITHLGAGQLLEIGGNAPMTVIAVRKEGDRS